MISTLRLNCVVSYLKSQELRRNGGNYRAKSANLKVDFRMRLKMSDVRSHNENESWCKLTLDQNKTQPNE